MTASLERVHRCIEDLLLALETAIAMQDAFALDAQQRRVYRRLRDLETLTDQIASRFHAHFVDVEMAHLDDERSPR